MNEPKREKIGNLVLTKNNVKITLTSDDEKSNAFSEHLEQVFCQESRKGPDQQEKEIDNKYKKYKNTKKQPNSPDNPN